MPATVALNGTMPAADCMPALGNGSVPTSCQLVAIDDGVLKSVVNELVRWKSCSSLVAVPVGPAPPAITIWRSSIVAYDPVACALVSVRVNSWAAPPGPGPLAIHVAGANSASFWLVTSYAAAPFVEPATSFPTKLSSTSSE